MNPKLQEHKNQQWVILSKRGRMSPLPNVYSMEAVSTLTPTFLDGLTYNRMILTFQNRNMYLFVDKESYDAIEKAGISSLRKNPKVFTEQVAEIKIPAKELIDWLKTLQETELSEKSDQELIEIYEKYRAAYKEIYGRYFIVLILERALTAHLQEILKQKCDEKKAAYAFTLLTSELGAMHTKNEERDRLKLAWEIAENQDAKKLFEGNEIESSIINFPEINDKVNVHTEKYFWITRDYEDPILTKRDFIEKIKQALQNKNLRKDATDAEAMESLTGDTRKRLEKELDLTEQEINDFAAMREGIYLKELRKSIVSQSLYYFDHVLEEMEKRTSLPLHLLRMMLPEDLAPILIEKKQYQMQLEQRYERSAYVMENGEHVLYEGKEAEELFNKVVSVDKNVKSLKGISASAGIAQGPARIVRHPSDFDKVQDGDIMITVQAVPSFIHTLRKCKGLVADGGSGITSHPATLAREVGIPCVVQTKTATEILQDGDIVEVNGDKGIVTIIEKRKEEGKEGPRENKIEEEFPCRENNAILMNDEPNMNLINVMPILHGGHSSATEKIVGMHMETAIVEFNERRLRYFIDNDINKKYGETAFKMIRKEKDLLKSIKERMESIAKDVYALGEEITKKEKRVTEKERAELFDILYEKYKEMCMYGFITVLIEVENELFTKKAMEEIELAIKREHATRSAQEYFTILSSITEKSWSKMEKEALLDLAIKIKKEEMTQEQKETEFEEIQRKFFWVSHGYTGPGKSNEEYRKELNKINQEKKYPEKQKEEMKSDEQELKKKQEQYRDELKFTEEQYFAIECLQETMYMKVMRRDFMAYTSHIILLLLEEVKKKYNLTNEELQFLTPYEAREVLAGKKEPKKEELRERTQYCLYLYNNEKEQVLTGEEAKNMLGRYIIKEKNEKREIKEIKGMTAYIGNITGRAVIVNTKEDMKKIEEGDILVSYATSPEIIPAMEKAAAFITDHGGATCHAAIVAREMKKPCIIGTKIATKVIQNGDIVEVNGNTGTVTIIEKKN